MTDDLGEEFVKKTDVELLRDKVDKVLATLKDKKNNAEEDAKTSAVRLANMFRDKSADSKELRERHYLNYQIAKTAGEAFEVAINQIEWNI